MKYNKLLDIDDDDKKILQLLQDNCEITHKEIAEKIDKSQPAVGARILKLERRNLLVKQMGINFKEADVKYARISVAASNSDAVWNKFGKCPVIQNIYKRTGKFNLSLDIVAPSVSTIEKFIDQCLRSDERIMGVRTTYLIDSANPCPLKINFDMEDYENKGCNQICKGELTKSDVDKLLSD